MLKYSQAKELIENMGRAGLETLIEEEGAEFVEDVLEEIDASDLEDFIEEHGADKIKAALECSVQLEDIEEAYQGQYRDDETFAQEMAEQLGEVSKDNGWPHYCIDWEYAARELMTDYSESNGHYFRNF